MWGAPLEGAGSPERRNPVACGAEARRRGACPTVPPMVAGRTIPARIVGGYLRRTWPLPAAGSLRGAARRGACPRTHAFLRATGAGNRAGARRPFVSAGLRLPPAATRGGTMWRAGGHRNARRESAAGSGRARSRVGRHAGGGVHGFRTAGDAPPGAEVVPDSGPRRRRNRPRGDGEPADRVEKIHGRRRHADRIFRRPTRCGANRAVRRVRGEFRKKMRFAICIPAKIG